MDHEDTSVCVVVVVMGLVYGKKLTEKIFFLLFFLPGNVHQIVDTSASLT